MGVVPQLIGLILFGLLITAMLFGLVKKVWSIKPTRGRLFNIVLRHSYSSFFLIGLWIFSLLAHQSISLFEDGTKGMIKAFSTAIFLVTVYYSIDLIFRYIYHFFYETLTENEFLKKSYKKLHHTVRLLSIAVILFYAASSQNLFNLSFIPENLWRWINYFFDIVTSSILAITLVNFSDNLYTSFYQKARNQALLIKAFSRPIVFLFLAYLIKISSIFFTLSAKAEQNLDNIYFIFLTLSASYFSYCIAELLTIVAFNYSKKSNKIIDISIINLATMTIRLLIVVTAFLLIAQRLTGQKLEGIIAAMGIGGVAFALASQDLLKNLLAGVTIMLDKPFTLGQSVNALSYDGVIEQIGFRSTLLRTFEGQLVTMPNSKLADSPIKNITDRNFLRRTSTLRLSYQNNSQAIELALKVIKEILSLYRHELTQEPVVVFNDIAADALNIMLTYNYANYTDTLAFYQFNQTISLEILRQFEDNNIIFAAPPMSSPAKEPQ